MRIYNPGPEINVVHGRSGINPTEIAAREAAVKAGKRGGPVSRPSAFVIPARTALDVPDQVGNIVLRVHAKKGVVRINRPTTEAKQIGAADRHYLLNIGAQPEAPVAPEPVAPEPEVVEEKPKAKRAAKKK